MAVDGTTAPGDDPGATGIRQAGLVVNNGSRILDFIKEQLRTCDEFWFGVAFLTSSGVVSLSSTLKRFAGLPRPAGSWHGQVFVSDYNDFTQPEALRKLREFERHGIKSRLLVNSNFHGKSFLFRHGGTYRLVIGSANLTASALMRNDELNLDVTTTHDNPVIQDFLARFNANFAMAQDLDEAAIGDYERRYRHKRQITGRVEQDLALQGGAMGFRPNQMQLQALDRLRALRDAGGDRALLISATGTGKTVLAALDVKAHGARTMLFVAHRQDIIRQARDTFAQVFGDEGVAGMYDRPLDVQHCRFLFATTQKLSRPGQLEGLAPDRFDYLIIDETHHAAAATYQRIIDHFTPRFLLGMTATPERMDQLGKERADNTIFRIFDSNIAHEIRLHEALEEGMLCPFHYFGISTLKDSAGAHIEDLGKVRQLPPAELVRRLITAIKEYRADDLPVRGLVFCTGDKQATWIKDELDADPEIIAKVDTSRHSDDERLAVWLNEDQDGRVPRYKYLVVVDKYNEGVDIPRLNQVVMLRPTDSLTVFIQQLGRGLRLHGDKEYLTVIDFIGNHKKNYLIPNALYGYRTRSGNDQRDMLAGTNRKYRLPAGCTVDFDEISRKLIYKAINERRSVAKELLDDYQARKLRLGRIPMMCDFDPKYDVDPLLFAERKHGSYYGFLADVAEADSKELPKLDQAGRQLLADLNRSVTNGARADEPLLLQMLMATGQVREEAFQQEHMRRYGHAADCPPGLLADYVNMAVIEHSIDGKYKSPFSLHEHKLVRHAVGMYEAGPTLVDACRVEGMRRFLDDAVAHGLRSYAERRDGRQLVDGFFKQTRYTCDDIQRVLNRPKYMIPQNFTTNYLGYDGDGNPINCPILLYYHKALSQRDDVGYEDHFSPDGREFHWSSTRNWKMHHKRIRDLLDTNTRKYLFVRKHKEESEHNDYIFIDRIAEVRDVREESDCVRMTFILDKPVDRHQLDYITSKEIKVDKEAKLEEATLF